MPALILSKMLSADFSADNYFDGLKLMGIAFVFLLLIYVFTLPFTKIMKLEDKSRNVYSMQTLFGNVIFFAFPLFEALFGVLECYMRFFSISATISCFGRLAFIWQASIKGAALQTV